MSSAVLLPWSGGLDSTALLIHHLERGDYDAIYTFYTELPGDKATCEKIAIHAITEALMSTPLCQGTVMWDHQKYDFDYPPCNPTEGILQPSIWLLNLAFYAGHIGINHDEVHVEIGYIRGDSALRREERIIDAWTSISGLTRLDHDPFELRFPFRGMSKGHIHRRLLQSEEKYGISSFTDLPWTCEEPEMFSDGVRVGYKSCGTCMPCTRDPRRKEKIT